MRLVEIATPSDEAWKCAIGSGQATLLYHRSDWLAVIEAVGRGTVLRFRIEDEGTLRGHFAGLLLSKGPFRILGSPLSGTMTEHMGPILDAPAAATSFIDALDHYCRSQGIHHVEIGHPWLDPVLMRAKGFNVDQWMTFRVPLTADLEEMWAKLSSKCRNRIRRGKKNRLIVEDTDDPAFLDEHVAQLEEVFGRQGLRPEYSKEDLQALIERLKPRDMVFTVQVRHADTNAVVASGIFPHDDRSVYAVSTASWLHLRHLCPNELMHWTVMSWAGSRGLHQYNVGDNYREPPSGGGFKNKFAGSYETVYRYRKNYSVWAGLGRKLYRSVARLRRRRPLRGVPARPRSAAGTS